MSDILKRTLKLVVITLIAGALLGGTYVITKEPIAEQELKAATEARQQVIDAAAFDQIDIAGTEGDYPDVAEAYAARDESGAVVGATVKLTTKGFNPGIVLTVGIGIDGTVTGVNIGDNEETPGLGAKAKEESFYGQYAGKSADSPLEVIKSGTAGDHQIQAIAGATITSKGVTNGVNTAVDFYNNVLTAKISEG